MFDFVFIHNLCQDDVCHIKAKATPECTTVFIIYINILNVYIKWLPLCVNGFVDIIIISYEDSKHNLCCTKPSYCDDVIMGAIASQITSLAIVYSAFYSGADQRKHQSSASLAFVRGIHRGPVNSPHVASITENVSISWRHHVNNGDAYHCIPITRVMRGPLWTTREDKLIAYHMIKIYNSVKRYKLSVLGVEIHSIVWPQNTRRSEHISSVCVEIRFVNKTWSNMLF